jgi:hypothetical protein
LTNPCLDEVGIVSGDRTKARPFTSRIRNDLVALKGESEVDNAGDDDEQQREYER